MNEFLELTGVALAALLSENLVLVTCMGTGSRVRSLVEPADALRTGGCLTAVMLLTALLSWIADRILLSPMGWEHLRLLAFALLVSAVVSGLRTFARHCLPELSASIDGNLAAISTNGAALGTALLVSQRSYGLAAALTFAFFGGLGATLALASFASLQLEVNLERAPQCFRGIPIKLITAGLMALALVGFHGLHLS